MWQWIRKYSWTPTRNSHFEHSPRHPCDSHFPKGISALSWSFPLENWNKTNAFEMITHYTSCQQCLTVSNSVNSVNSFNSYSAVLPPSPMVFLLSTTNLTRVGVMLCIVKCTHDQLILSTDHVHFNFWILYHLQKISIGCFRCHGSNSWGPAGPSLRTEVIPIDKFIFFL